MYIVPITGSMLRNIQFFILYQMSILKWTCNVHVWSIHLYMVICHDVYMLICIYKYSNIKPFKPLFVGHYFLTKMIHKLAVTDQYVLLVPIMEDYHVVSKKAFMNWLEVLCSICLTLNTPASVDQMNHMTCHLSSCRFLHQKDGRSQNNSSLQGK